MLDGLQKRLASAVKKIRGVTRLSEADVDAVLSEVRTGFLEADVHFRVTKDFLARVRERCLRGEVVASLSPEQHIVKILSEELTQILGGESRELDLASAPPVVILMVGLQGSGKTTSSAKLARLLKSKGRRPALVSVDVQRPAAMEQLRALGTREDVPVLDSSPTQKPIDIAREALKSANNKNCDVLIVDTAGRLQVDAALMQELKELRDLLKPKETLLVIDAMMGQQAVEVAEGFDREIGLSGAILSKLDGDARGGAALSLVAVTGKPIKFIGTGERPTDFEVFHPDRIASRLLDMGDFMSLLEKAQEVISEDDAMKAGEKLLKADFSFEDFLDQMKMISKMGSFGGLLKMLPGMGALKDQLEQVDTDKEMKRVEAMIQSMTHQERRNPDVLNGGRKARIAKGSGMAVSEVNSFVKRFLDARKMMRQMGKMGGLMKGLGKMGTGANAPGQSAASAGTPWGQNPGLPFGRRSGGKGFGRKF
jgi:signal recognition particle subunit SRP54